MSVSEHTHTQRDRETDRQTDRALLVSLLSLSILRTKIKGTKLAPYAYENFIEEKPKEEERRKRNNPVRTENT